jgi:hypothetical protein
VLEFEGLGGGFWGMTERARGCWCQWCGVWRLFLLLARWPSCGNSHCLQLGDLIRAVSALELAAISQAMFVMR